MALTAGPPRWEIARRTALKAGAVRLVVQQSCKTHITGVKISTSLATRLTSLAVSVACNESLTATLNTLTLFHEESFHTHRAVFRVGTLCTVCRARNTLCVVQSKRSFGTGRNAGEMVQEVSYRTLKTVVLIRTSARPARLVAVPAGRRRLVKVRMRGTIFET